MDSFCSMATVPSIVVSYIVIFLIPALSNARTNPRDLLEMVEMDGTCPVGWIQDSQILFDTG